MSLEGDRAGRASAAPAASAAAEPTGAASPLNRMGISLLSLAGLFVAGYLLLSNLGLTGPLVCGVGDCGTVQASPWAVFLGVPVPAWGVAGYAALFGTALAGVRPAAVADRRIAALLLVLSFVAFAFSAYLTALEAFVIHAWCQWCVISAVLATLIFVLSLAELPRLKRN